MSERTSSLNQRVRRLLGSSSLDVHEPAHHHSTRGDTATLFEARIAKLSHVLDELRAVDMEREYELRALREQLMLAEERARRELSTALAPALTEIDVLLHRGRALLAPPEEPPTTPFDRMRARRNGQRSDTRQQEQLAALISHLAALRIQLAALAEE